MDIKEAAMIAIRDCLKSFSENIDNTEGTAPEKVEALQYALSKVLIDSSADDNSAFNAAACACAMLNATQQALMEKLGEIDNSCPAACSYLALLEKLGEIDNS